MFSSRAAIVVAFVLCAAALPARATTYQTAIAADAPIAYYSFEDGAGAATAANAGSAGATGDYLGSPTLTTAGVSGNAVRFNDSSEYVKLPSSFSPSSLSSFSIEFWARFPTGFPSNHRYYFYDNYLHNTYLYVDSSSATSGSLATSQGNSTTQSFGDGAFHHFVLTSGSNSTKLYYDGVLVSTAAASPALTMSSGFKIGGYSGTTSGTQYSVEKGLEDEFAIYGVVLTSTQVSTHYAAGVSQMSGGGDPVPEPAGFALALLGGAALLRSRASRRAARG